MAVRTSLPLVALHAVTGAAGRAAFTSRAVSAIRAVLRRRVTPRALLMMLCLAGWPAAGFADAATADAATSSAASARTASSISSAGGTGATAAAETDAQQKIKRFAQVDDRLYRGGQPDADGFRALRDLGIRTVVSLRTGNAEAERQIVTSLGMRFVQIPVTLHPFGFGADLPSAAIAQFFSIVDNPASGAVFVHCRRGADRTGTFVGMYRIARQGWEGDDAYDEARAIGMRWWHYPVKGHLEEFATSPLAAAPAAAPAPTVSAPASTAAPAATSDAGVAVPAAGGPPPSLD